MVPSPDIDAAFALIYVANEFCATAPALHAHGKQPPAMADRHSKTPNNVAGRYYVDETCIDCGLCREIAPATFSLDDVNRVSFAWRQPVTTEEIALAEQAVECCPTESVGNDG